MKKPYPKAMFFFVCVSIAVYFLFSSVVGFKNVSLSDIYWVLGTPIALIWIVSKIDDFNEWINN